MQSKAATVAEYLGELPADRRISMAIVREVICRNLPKGIVEQMGYGMISYVVPHSFYPAGYHCDPKQPLPFAALASQKNYMALYLTTVYQDPKFEAWMRRQFQARGRKPDMGKSCIRFRKLDDLPLDVIGEAIAKVSVADFIRCYEDASKAARTGKR